MAPHQSPHPGIRTNVAHTLIALTAVAFASTGCSQIAATSSLAPTSQSAAAGSPGATPTVSSPRPSVDASTRSPTARASGVVDREPAGAASPVWFPHWSPTGDRGVAEPWPADWPRPAYFGPDGSGHLDGRTIVLDPGHNSGNATHGAQINQRYWVGLTKICNTTGTATDSGYAEAAYSFDVARRLRLLLTAAGASVIVTRDGNNTSTYGPCVQARGLLGGQVGADATVSIHADGGPASGRGTFVYVPAVKPGYSDSAKAAASRRLGTAIAAGMAAHGLPASTYLHPQVAAMTDQGTLNTASVPVAIVETLNFRNHLDAAIATSTTGRQRVAEGLFQGILRFLTAA